MGKLESVDRRVASFMRIERRAVVFWLIYGAAGFVLWLVFGVWVPGCQYAGQMATCKQNIHAIQLAVERYAVDASDECYPPMNRRHGPIPQDALGKVEITSYLLTLY